jgi:ubiquinone/menaquinone biosynthesis C-methylase UbiE
MDLEDLKRVNHLWSKIYPYLALQIAEVCQKDSGAVLELGPFSGGISMELVKRYPGFNITIADRSSNVLSYLDREIRSSGLSKSITIRKTAFTPLVFKDAEFDLVISRGVFFFLDENGNLLYEIFRVLKKGGMAFIGGAFGKDTPKELIDEISDESRVLNDRLGRRRITLDELEKIIHRAELVGSCRIVEEGGLWVVIDKQN